MLCKAIFRFQQVYNSISLDLGLVSPVVACMTMIMFVTFTGEIILQVFARFEGIRDAVSLHMVEVSPKLSEMQQEKLSGVPTSQPDSSSTDSQPSRLGQSQSTVTSNEESSSDLKCYRSCRSKHGPPVSWYRRVQDVPRGFSFYLAHEFFDALPIHKFQVGVMPVSSEPSVSC